MHRSLVATLHPNTSPVDRLVLARRQYRQAIAVLDWHRRAGTTVIAPGIHVGVFKALDELWEAQEAVITWSMHQVSERIRHHVIFKQNFEGDDTLPVSSGTNQC